MTLIAYSWVMTATVMILAIYGLVELCTDRSSHEKDMAILWVLMSSCDDEGMLALDICKITGVSQSTIYIRLNRLETRGLVTVTRDVQWPHRFRYHVDSEFKIHHLNEEALNKKERA